MNEQLFEIFFELLKTDNGELLLSRQELDKLLSELGHFGYRFKQKTSNKLVRFTEQDNISTTRVLTSDERCKIHHHSASLLFSLERIGLVESYQREFILQCAMELDCACVELTHMKQLIYHVLSQDTSPTQTIWLKSIIDIQPEKLQTQH